MMLNLRLRLTSRWVIQKVVHRTEQKMLLLGCGRGGSAGRLAVDHPQDERRTCIIVPRTQDTISKSDDDKIDSESCNVVCGFARYIEISQSSVVMPGDRQMIVTILRQTSVKTCHRNVLHVYMYTGHHFTRCAIKTHDANIICHRDE